jgi:hypothetical protein
MRDDFCVFILSYNRPKNVPTVEALEEYGYTGDWYIIIDHADDIEPYTNEWGEENVIVLDKDDALPELDRGDNLNRRDCNVYARFQSFDVAKELGYDYFALFDDDYTRFSYKWDENGNYTETQKVTNLDGMFSRLVEYLETANLHAIATTQSGDWMGGENATVAANDGKITATRKVMNTFVCKADRPFDFRGSLNEDVNTYVRGGQLGNLFLTTNLISVHQERTQQEDGGLTDIYLDHGTYMKSFYTILYSPSSVKLGKLGYDDLRIHHHVRWRKTVPKIVPESTKN